MLIKGNRTLKSVHKISTPIWVNIYLHHFQAMWNSIGYTGLQLLRRASWTLARHLIPGKYNSSLSRRAWMRLVTTIFDLSLFPGVIDIITSSEATERCLIGVSQINKLWSCNYFYIRRILTMVKHDFINSLRNSKRPQIVKLRISFNKIQNFAI